MRLGEHAGNGENSTGFGGEARAGEGPRGVRRWERSPAPSEEGAVRKNSSVGRSQGGAPPRGRSREPLEGGGRGRWEPAGSSAQHPSRPGAPTRSAAVAAASFSPRAPRPAPHHGRNVGRQELGPRRTCPGPDLPPDPSPAPGRAAPGLRSPTPSLPAAGTLCAPWLGEEAQALALEDGRGAPSGSSSRFLQSWLSGVRRQGGREGPWGDRPGGEWLLGGPLASGGPARPPSERRQVRAFSLFPARPERTLAGNE